MFRNKYACRIAENVSLETSFDRIDFSDRNARTGSRDSSRRINDQTFSWYCSVNITNMYLLYLFVKYILNTVFVL